VYNFISDLPPAIWWCWGLFISLSLWFPFLFSVYLSFRVIRLTDAISFSNFSWKGFLCKCCLLFVPLGAGVCRTAPGPPRDPSKIGCSSSVLSWIPLLWNPDLSSLKTGAERESVDKEMSRRSASLHQQSWVLKTACKRGISAIGRHPWKGSFEGICDFTKLVMYFSLWTNLLEKRTDASLSLMAHLCMVAHP